MPKWSPQSETALLSFSLGPVQTFIESARTVRDLWSGSYIVAWLTAAAMKPIRELDGTRVLLPSLDGNRLADAVSGQLFQSERHSQLLTPCLPNRFVAEVPAKRAKDLATTVEEACFNEWQTIADAVKEALRGQFSQSVSNYDDLWDLQTKSYFEIRTMVLPLVDCSAETLDRLGIPHGSFRELDLLAGAMNARRAVRHVPDYFPPPDERGRFPVKCNLLGSYEQIGPAEFEAASRFWQDRARWSGRRGTRIGKYERLCAVSLTKRFAWPVYFCQKLNIDPKALRYEDTATIAAASWLRTNPPIVPQEERNKTRIWNGLWLHWSKCDENLEDADECPKELFDRIRAKGKAPTYYAILMADGDRMGQLLRGDGTNDEFGNDRQRPLRISQRLTEFALKHAERIVEQEHDGELIYAGGDDALALLPTTSVLNAAVELETKYREIMKHPKATVSAGIAVVHYKEDLRFAMKMAREAEKSAKGAGRNCLTLTICRRSGEHSTATMGWDQVAVVERLVGSYCQTTISDRWSYKLRAMVSTLEGLPWPVIETECDRILKRLEGNEAVLEEFRLTIRAIRELTKIRSKTNAEALRTFVILAQSASFLARGRGE